jgi:hypothetical protein
VEFLGYIIFGNNIRMDLCKVQTIVDWAILASVQDVQCFFGFITFIDVSLPLFFNSDPFYLVD